jgi:hypothetical protein
MDVAQAADPLKLQAATSKLAARAAGTAGTTSFAAALAAGGAGLTAMGPTTRPALLPPTTASFGNRPAESKQVTTDRKFEAVVLQNFVENIMPKDTELFGDKASADMVRTLMAEQISNQLARSSSFGIAKSLERFQNAQQKTDAPPLPLTLPGATRV